MANNGTVAVTDCCATWTVNMLIQNRYCSSQSFSVGAVPGNWRLSYGHNGAMRVALSLCGTLRAKCECALSIFRHGQSHYTTTIVREYNKWLNLDVLANDEMQIHVKLWNQGTVEPVCPHTIQEGRHAESATSCSTDPVASITQNLAHLCNSASPTNDPLSLAFEKWHNDQLYADMIVMVEQQRFKIHKLVFAARSQVFHRMFGQGMLESNTSCVQITDITPEGFRQLAEYMYTGRVVGIKNSATDLLNAAEKYDLEGLKEMCEEGLITTISEESAVSMLCLADLYRAPKLKNAALEFIKRHGRAVTSWVGWTSLLTENPRLATEVFHYLISPNTSK